MGKECSVLRMINIKTMNWNMDSVCRRRRRRHNYYHIENR